jgi:hypothetical protein
MSSFATIEKLKEELSRFQPSSNIYTATKSSYNQRLSFTKKHEILPPKEQNKYTQIINGVVEENQNIPGVYNSINQEMTLKKLYMRAVFDISRAIKHKVSRKQYPKYEEILRWLEKKGKLFSDGYYSHSLPWKEDATVEAILKICVWLNDKERDVKLREQTAEVIKLLIIKEKESYGK